MTKFVALAAAGLLSLALGACASQPHSDATMLAGSHPMAPKAGNMSDRAMPDRSANCSEDALKNMPPEHRKMCEQAPKPQ